MAYYTTGIEAIGSEDVDAGVLLRVSSTNVGKFVQCYLSGVLIDWQMPVGGVASFSLPKMLDTDTLFFLAVDTDTPDTDYFDDAYPLASANGNRITVVTPMLTGLGTDLKWRIYRSDAGGATADILVHEESYYDGRNTGYGSAYGEAYGFGVAYGGYGSVYGTAYGFGSTNLTWASEPLPPGVYKVKVTVEDAAGNESAGTTDTITLTTYPRPATEMSITSYDSGTDTLTLGWTASPDIT